MKTTKCSPIKCRHPKSLGKKGQKTRKFRGSTDSKVKVVYLMCLLTENTQNEHTKEILIVFFPDIKEL